MIRVGVMLRSLDERGGISIYTRYILEELLKRDRKNHYVLFYRNPSHLGRFGHYRNVSERHVRPTSKALWDQIAIPYMCWRERVDVLFHPKFTVPLLAPCKAVMVVHGADWFIPDQAVYYRRLDVNTIKLTMPLYFRKAAAVISVSQLTTENFKRALDLPDGKIKTIYFGPGRHFRKVTDPSALSEARARYKLPEEFIFTLTKADGGERKNFRQIVEAYALHHGRTPHKLVVGGKDCHILREVYGIPKEGYGRDVVFPGWIDQQDLPAVYSLADMFLYPSNVEAFPIPITEALACGTPIVTSRANGLEEIAGNAALYVDPRDATEIAAAIELVLSNPVERGRLTSQGFERSALFSWERCAQETLELLERVAH